MRFDKLPGKGTSEEKKKNPKVLPWDVAYALQNRKGQLNKAEIHELAENHFENEALYLLIKSLINTPSKHRKLLESYLAFFQEHQDSITTNPNVLKDFILKVLSETKELSVKSGKLVQLSVQGFDLWQEKMKALAVQLSTDDRNIYIVAHSMLVGFNSFLEAFSKQQKTLNIFIPEWIGTEHIGYIVSFKNGATQVEWLLKNLDGSRGSVVVDDTIRTGTHAKKLGRFFMRHGAQEPEIKVINTVPGAEK